MTLNLIENSILNDIVKHPEKIAKLKFDVISKILISVKKIFELENLLLEFDLVQNTEIAYIIGDIHGNLETLVKLLTLINKKNPTLK